MSDGNYICGECLEKGWGEQGCNKYYDSISGKMYCVDCVETLNKSLYKKVGLYLEPYNNPDLIEKLFRLNKMLVRRDELDEYVILDEKRCFTPINGRVKKFKEEYFNHVKLPRL